MKTIGVSWFRMKHTVVYLLWILSIDVIQSNDLNGECGIYKHLSCSYIWAQYSVFAKVEGKLVQSMDSAFPGQRITGLIL